MSATSPVSPPQRGTKQITVLRLLRRRINRALSLVEQHQFEAAFSEQSGIDELIAWLAEQGDQSLDFTTEDICGQCLQLNDLLQEILDTRRDEAAATLRAVRLENNIAVFLNG